jgi:hypothetical protein
VGTKKSLDLLGSEAHTKDMSFACDQCFDTKMIDRDGAEIPCPYCAARYHPLSVTIETRDDSPLFWVIDRSQDAQGRVYRTGRTYSEAVTYRNKRRGVIKAALTRRANKKNK